MIQNGSIVIFDPMWSKREERKYIFGVKNLNQEINRRDIVCLNDRYSIGSYIETVCIEMIVDTELTIEKDVFPVTF